MRLRQQLTFAPFFHSAARFDASCLLFGFAPFLQQANLMLAYAADRTDIEAIIFTLEADIYQEAPISEEQADAQLAQEKAGAEKWLRASESFKVYDMEELRSLAARGGLKLSLADFVERKVLSASSRMLDRINEYDRLCITVTIEVSQRAPKGEQP